MFTESHNFYLSLSMEKIFVLGMFFMILTEMFTYHMVCTSF